MIFSFGKNMTSQIVILNLTPYKWTVCELSGNLVINPCHRESAVFGAHYDRLGTHISSFKHRFWGGKKNISVTGGFSPPRETRHPLPYRSKILPEADLVILG